MTFKKKYTDEMVMRIVEKYSDIVSTRQIQDTLGCTQVTANTLLKNMLATGKLSRVNIGTDNKPVWVYSRVNKSH